MPDLAGQRTIKRFRVAREGQTVDGRAISRQHILEMANTYNPVEYTARINVEHSSGWGGLSSDNYPILGDVIAVDAQLDEYTINGVKVQLMGLYATLSALPVLVEAIHRHTGGLENFICDSLNGCHIHRHTGGLESL